jgi:hypothetical protein
MKIRILLAIIMTFIIFYVEGQVGQSGATYYFIMAHDDYHERYGYEPRDYPPNAKFIGDNYNGFQNSIYSLERGILNEEVNITQHAGRDQHEARIFMPSYDLFILRTEKLFVYDLRNSKIIYADTITEDLWPGRYSQFYRHEEEVYYSNYSNNGFINLREVKPTDQDMRVHYLDYISDGNEISRNLFPFQPNICFSSGDVYGFQAGESYPIKARFSWPEYVSIDLSIGNQVIRVSNDHVLVLVKWLNGSDSSTGEYSVYNKTIDKWSQFKLPQSAPIRYQDGWLIGAYYEGENKCTTVVNLSQHKELIDFKQEFVKRYTLKHGIWPNTNMMHCQHFIYHVDSEQMGIVNLEDHDSEILYVFDDRVVYRIYDCIYEAPIHIVGDEIEVVRRSEQLLVQDEDIVPNIHYMYVR